MLTIWQSVGCNRSGKCQPKLVTHCVVNGPLMGKYGHMRRVWNLPQAIHQETLCAFTQKQVVCGISRVLACKVLISSNFLFTLNDGTSRSQQWAHPLLLNSTLGGDFFILTHWSIVMPYDNTEFGQSLGRSWLFSTKSLPFLLLIYHQLDPQQ